MVISGSPGSADYTRTRAGCRKGYTGKVSRSAALQPRLGRRRVFVKEAQQTCGSARFGPFVFSARHIFFSSAEAYSPPNRPRFPRSEERRVGKSVAREGT